MIVSRSLRVFVEVGELLGEEPVALLEGLELLEGERVDASELREFALGGGQTGLLVGADIDPPLRKFRS